MSTKTNRNESEETSKNRFLHHIITKKNKWPIIVNIFLIFLCIVLFALALFFALRTKDDDICLTKDCALTASFLIDAMDTTVDPCQNFQQFVCANFIRKHLPAEEEVSKNIENIFNTYFDLQMKDVFETPHPLGQPHVIFRLQEAYHVCINATHQPDKEIEALKNYIIDFLQWPLASGNKWEPKFNLTGLLINLYDVHKGESQFHIVVHEWRDFSSWTIATIEAIPLFMFEDYDNYKGKERENVKDKMIRAVVRLFGNNDNETIDKDIEDMKHLFKYEMQSEPDTQKAIPKEISIENLTELFDNKIDWLQILNRQTKEEIYTFSLKDFVTLQQPENMALSINVLNRFPLRVIYNIIGWKNIFHNLLILAGPTAEKLIKIFEDAFPDYKQKEPLKNRWLDCLKDLQEVYPMAMTRMFVDKYINRSDKTSADELIQWVQKAYRATISQSSWVDKETKNNAIKKIDSIRRLVGYPDYIFDDEALNKEYAHMPEIQSSHFQNTINLIKVKDKLPPLTAESSKTDKWFRGIFPLEVEAYYISYSNSIYFPTGILQLPYFVDARLAAVNFGMIGSIIGHEIGHAFNLKIKAYDEPDWWTKETNAIIDEKAQCFIEQFNDYCPEELKGNKNETFCVNGKLTLNENVADYTGVSASFSAYKMWVKKHGQEKRLPGLQEYTPEQIFFISFAYIWCENFPLDKWINQYEYSLHSPRNYRILGPLSNSKEFRETFNCPEGPMNRGKDSCVMW